MGRATWFSAVDRPALEDLWRVHTAHAQEIAEETRRRISMDPVFAAALADDAEQGGACWSAFLKSWSASGRADQARSDAALQRCQEFFSARDVEMQRWVQACLIVQAQLTPHLIAAYGADRSRLSAALEALNRQAAWVLDALERGLRQTRERELRDAREATLFADARFESLVESGMLGVLVCDYAGNIVEANDGFLETFGYSRDDLSSGRVQWSTMTPAEWRHLDESAIEQLRMYGKTRPWEKEYFHKDGSRVPVLVGVASLNEAQTVAFVLDISERKRLEAVRARSIELEAENRRIQEASRLKSEFLANMSHELRTPLNCIIGYTELLRDRDVEPDSPQYDEFLGNILKSGWHLQRLINDVLDLAKVEAGKIELRPEEVDIAELIAEVSSVLRAVASSKQIRIESDVSPDALRVTLDPGRFKQVLYNYLSNAIKFTPEKGRVWVTARREDPDLLCLTVEDSGIGIAASDLGRLFVDFQQLEGGATKRHAGTGLGLALTKRLVEAQGGSVGVKSTLGRGSRFFARIPLHVPASGVRIDRASAPPAARKGASTVLVIEDDACDRALITQTLARAGYAVEAAATGRQAVASCSERSFDAILLDLLLPDMTGLDVLHRLRLEGKNQYTPVIVVSVMAERGMVAGFGAQAYLSKPVDGRVLLKALEQARVPPHKGGRILVVDDDPIARRLMATTLEELGYDIQVSPGGEDALASAGGEPPIAVVLDPAMSGMDGLEFLRRFREPAGNRSVPVIVWTRKDLAPDERKRLRGLAQGIVAKSSWRPEMFLEELRGLVVRPGGPSASELA